MATALGATGGAAFAGEGEVRGADVTDAVKDSYIVVLKDKAADAPTVRTTASALTSATGGTVARTFSRSVKGYSVHMTEKQAKRLAARSEVAYVEQNHKVKKSGSQADPPSWGLDRIDQSLPSLDHAYNYPNTASSVHAYVVDSGIRVTHRDFGGRASYGYDFVSDGTVADDCDGHGTHVAGTIGGSTYGVAKGVQLVAVRVLGCDGAGTADQVIAGVEWVTANAVKPAVANLSLGLDGSSSTLDDAIRASIASGVVYSVAAGNANANACAASPGDVAEAITVGATDQTDVRASFSNYGPCVDVFAPGVGITSSFIDSDTGRAMDSGTSMAAPHVAGAAAMILASDPSKTPQQVRDRIVSDAVPDAVHKAGDGSPARLLHVGAAAGSPASPLRAGGAVSPTGPLLSADSAAVPAAAPAAVPVAVPAALSSFALFAHANNRYVSSEQGGRAPLIANRRALGAWETFEQHDAGDGFIALRSPFNGAYLSAERAGTAPLIANRRAIGPWERFKLINNADGSISLMAAVNGRYVTAENAGRSSLVANRTAIGPWEKFDKAGPATMIRLQAAVNHRYVTAGTAGRSSLVASRTVASAGEQFDQYDVGGGFIALRSRANGLFVTAERGGRAPLVANRRAIGPWEKFKLINNADGSISLMAAVNGRYVTAENAGRSSLIANRTAIGSWEKFYRLT